MESPSSTSLALLWIAYSLLVSEPSLISNQLKRFKRSLSSQIVQRVLSLNLILCTFFRKGLESLSNPRAFIPKSRSRFYSFYKSFLWEGKGEILQQDPRCIKILAIILLIQPVNSTSAPQITQAQSWRAGFLTHFFWSLTAVEIALTAKEKIGFIDGTRQKPPSTSPLVKQWNLCAVTRCFFLGSWMRWASRFKRASFKLGKRCVGRVGSAVQWHGRNKTLSYIIGAKKSFLYFAEQFVRDLILHKNKEDVGRSQFNGGDSAL